MIFGCPPFANVSFLPRRVCNPKRISLFFVFYLVADLIVCCTVSKGLRLKWYVSGRRTKLIPSSWNTDQRGPSFLEEVWISVKTSPEKQELLCKSEDTQQPYKKVVSKATACKKNSFSLESNLVQDGEGRGTSQEKKRKYSWLWLLPSCSRQLFLRMA